MSYPRCSSPQVELPRRSTPSRGHQRGWSQVSLESVHPSCPSLLSPCSQVGSTSLHPLVFTLSFRGGRRNIGKKHPAQWEARGWRRCYIPLLINIQSVEEVPHPHPRLTVLHTITYTALEELGLHQEEESSHHLPNTHPPTPTSSPPGLAPHPPVPSHPYGCE